MAARKKAAATKQRATRKIPKQQKTAAAKRGSRSTGSQAANRGYSSAPKRASGSGGNGRGNGRKKSNLRVFDVNDVEKNIEGALQVLQKISAGRKPGKIRVFDLREGQEWSAEDLRKLLEAGVSLANKIVPCNAPFKVRPT